LVSGQAREGDLRAQQWAALSESHVPCGLRPTRRELTPVLRSVRLSWRRRARPSATLHEIQICANADWNDLVVTQSPDTGKLQKLPSRWRRKLYRPWCAQTAVLVRLHQPRPGVEQHLHWVIRLLKAINDLLYTEIRYCRSCWLGSRGVSIRADRVEAHAVR
jgi:hypothetical protein